MDVNRLVEAVEVLGKRCQYRKCGMGLMPNDSPATGWILQILFLPTKAKNRQHKAPDNR